LATFLPCFFFTVILAPYFKKIASNRSVKAFVDGITASVVGALAGSVVIIGTRSIIDVPTAVIALATAAVLVRLKAVKEPIVILVGALLGLLIRL
jgi:chromate transporter